MSNLIGALLICIVISEAAQAIVTAILKAHGL